MILRFRGDGPAIYLWLTSVITARRSGGAGGWAGGQAWRAGGRACRRASGRTDGRAGGQVMGEREIDCERVMASHTTPLFVENYTKY